MGIDLQDLLEDGYIEGADERGVVFGGPERHGLRIVEDNAHGIGAYFRGRHLGTTGVFAAQSWHDTVIAP